MPCMRLKRFWMQNRFEAKALREAKSVLDESLKRAAYRHTLQKEHQKSLAEKPSVWQKIKGFFANLF